MRVLLSWLGATVPVVLARPAVAGPRFVSDDPEPTPFSSVHIRPVHSRRMPYLGALARMALIPPAASLAQAVRNTQPQTKTKPLLKAK